MMIRLTFLLSALLCIFITPASANEGAGLIASDLNGALPKGLWRNQSRSEINYLLKNLPADGPTRSVQIIKRNMLLSVYDTSLIKDDVDIKDGKDLLSLRLQKLLEMGLWEDAFTLYTKTTEDPGENNKLAQIGLQLILIEKGIATSCLEAKVLSPRYDDPFWKQIDAVCDSEIGTAPVADDAFGDSNILRALYSEDNFTIAADNITALETLSFLELALLLKKGRIKYPDANLPEEIPPHLIKTFLEDPKLPKSKKKPLEIVAYQKALLSESPVKNTEENEEKETKDVQALSQQDIIHLVQTKLEKDALIAKKEAEKMAELASENPENYFYLQILKEINATRANIEISEEQNTAAIDALSMKNLEKVNFLKSLLDKSPEFSNNPANVYEKQISLTPDGAYVMPTGGLTEWLKKTQENQLVGLSLLIVLSNIDSNAYAKKSGDNPEKDANNVLKSLSTVGLIDQAHLIAKEELANLMELNN